MKRFKTLSPTAHLFVYEALQNEKDDDDDDDHDDDSVL